MLAFLVLLMAGYKLSVMLITGLVNISNRMETRDME